MGVRGLTTFIATRSTQYLQNYELHDCYLVIDGNSLTAQLYRWHCKCNDCFGGDYDKFARVIRNFFQLLRQCNVVPLIILDGGYERRKLKTVYSRLKNRILTASTMSPLSQGTVFPLFYRDLFVDIAVQEQAKVVRCDFESDSELAFISRTLNCPLLSYDSDFYIFDVLYIPFITMELRVAKTRHENVNYIPCQVYRIDKFLNSFGGLNKVNLPILATLLGNDYVHKSTFSRFYSQLKMVGKGKHSDQQKRIKSVINWLQNETPESAIRKILGRYKLGKRKLIASKIEAVVEGYNLSRSTILKYLNIEISKPNENNPILSQLQQADSIPEPDNSDDDSSSSNSSQEEEPQEEVEEDIEKNYESSNTLNELFLENFRKCQYPSCFMDLAAQNIYYCLPQVEDYEQLHSHTISLRLIAALHKILTTTEAADTFVLVARDTNCRLHRTEIASSDKNLPKIQEIACLNSTNRKKLLLEILDLNVSNYLYMFPESWHFFIVSLHFWIVNSPKKIDTSYLYSIILCAIVLNYVDKNINFYRSNKAFFDKYGKLSKECINNNSPPNLSNSISELIQQIDKHISVECMRILIPYFQMEAKMRTNLRMFDRFLVHDYACFQSCLLHIKHLNCLLNFPFNNFIISEFYDGTFLYNMTANLITRNDPKEYLQLILKDSPLILHLLDVIVGCLQNVENVNSNIGKVGKAKRRRKKKKRNDDADVEMVLIQKSDDENRVFDKNNKFSLLSMI